MTDTPTIPVKHFLAIAVLCVTIIGSVLGSAIWAMDRMEGVAKEGRDSVQTVVASVDSLKDMVSEEMGSINRQVISLDTTLEGVVQEVSRVRNKLETNEQKIIKQGVAVEFIKEKVDKAHP